MWFSQWPLEHLWLFQVYPAYCLSNFKSNWFPVNDVAQVINHGFSAELMQGAMQMCGEFFALPMEEKQLYSMKTSSGIGYGRRMAVKEGVRVDWVDRLGFWSASEEHRKRQPLDVICPAAFK